jgi:predicted dehydrogenase
MSEARQDLSIGIVGLGAVAGAHIEAFQAVTGANITAVSSRRSLNEAELAAKYGQPLRPVSSYDELLADPDIDTVDICTPHHLHTEQAIAAAEAGKNVIIEKPISTNWEDALRIEAAVKANGVQAMVCFECRFSAQFSLVRSMLDQEMIGDVHYAEVDYFHGIGPWIGQFSWNVKKEIGTSSLATAGCHALDAILFLMDGEVEEVTSISTSSKSKIFEPYEYDTTCVTLLRFADGRIAKCASAIDCLQPYYFHVHLLGSHGSILDDRFYSHKLDGLNRAKWSKLETSLIDSGDVTDHPYQPQFQAFTDSTLAGKPMPRTSLETAMETHRVMFAADLSAAEGRPVRLDELPRE